MKLSICTVALLALQAATASIEPILNKLSITEHPDPAKRAQVQDFVKWDSESLFVNGERLMIFGGEFHFFRLPVPDLWLDIFHKVKALGFNCVSFYVHWGLMEGKHGDYLAEGIFALGSFFEAATKAGIYLIARPGPYINAETSGGGFPGWLQRVRGALRTNAPDYLASTDNYIANVDATIAKAQITNGGPIILYQPENEYSGACCNYTFPDPDYFQYVIEQARSAGIVVPMITNDAWTAGHNAPGTGKGSVDIYGYDNYPIGFDCANPTNWPAQENFPTNWRTTHLEQSPSSPLTIPDFQAGAYQPWGGDGFDHCAKLVNAEFERVLYKNNFSFKATILNLYMIFGGTNWGNLGHAGGYTSYDYASPIAEDRNITREKYSELKLIGNFMKVSPSYLNALPLNLTDSKYTSTSDLTVTPLIGQKSKSSFFVLRHSEYASLDSTDYKLHLPTSAGELTIPRLGGTLTLHGRDSKIHVADYDIDGTNILYSTAEIFTWKKFDSRKVLVVYGAAGERHELAVSKLSGASVLEGHQHGLKIEQIKDSVVINWETSSQRRIVEVGDLQIFILDRNSAYNYWVPQLSKDGSSIGYSSTENGASSIIVNAGYLVRSAHTYRDDLHIIADFNTTTTVEVIGAPPHVKNLYINGDRVRHHTDRNGIWSASVEYRAPSIDIPNLDKLEWKYTDGLPELRNDYDDSAWPAADREATNNTFRPLITPTSLYGSDYGFNTGYLVYRGHFVADGTEKTLNISTQGGTAFGSSVWLNQTLLGSWVGSGNYADQNSTYSLPQLEKGKPYVFTVLCDNMGLDGNWVVGQDLMKAPRGVLNYEIPGRDQSDITWKLTGNIGGEDYRDRVRGPLNEGGLYPERQGWHQPKPPTHSWGTASPTADGISKAGVGFFSTEFDLHIPKGWDVPLYFTFANETSMPDPYRVQLYVNGYQYGKFVSHIGPQTSYPVPQGVLNYDGPNWVAVTLWAPEERGAKIEGLKLEYREAVMTGFGDVEPKYIPAYEKREGAY